MWSKNAHFLAEWETFSSEINVTSRSRMDWAQDNLSCPQDRGWRQSFGNGKWINIFCDLCSFRREKSYKHFFWPSEINNNFQKTREIVPNCENLFFRGSFKKSCHHYETRFFCNRISLQSPVWQWKMLHKKFLYARLSRLKILKRSLYKELLTNWHLRAFFCVPEYAF